MHDNRFIKLNLTSKGQKTMKATDKKIIKEFCANLFSEPDFNEVIEHIDNGDNDFMVRDVRFINSNDIDCILANELESDRYVLGCFTALCIADATDWPIELIQAMQASEAFEKLGESLTRDHIEKLADIYSSNDGYGHHFNRYDFSEEELRVNGELFHVFDNH